MFATTAECAQYNLIEAIMNRPAAWYAIRVMSNRERTVASILAAKGFPVSLPICRSRRNRTGRLKESVLFPGYLFCSFDPKALLPIISVPGVVHIICRERMPVPVDPIEMEAIQQLAKAGLDSEPWPYIMIGERVRICEGPMAGVEGILAREGSRDRIVISISLLMRSVMVELDRTAVESIEDFVVV